MQDADISTNGQIGIPVNMRITIGISSEDAITAFEYGGTIHVIPKWKQPVF